MKTKKPTRSFAPEHLFSPSTANVMAISPLKASIALGVFVAYAATCSLAQGQVNNNTA